MIAVIDETSPEVGGAILYAVVSCVMIEDEAAAKQACAGVIGDRQRSFHWNKEGPNAREAMVRCMESVGVLARAVVVQCGRKSQEAARAVALADTIDHVLNEGCMSVLIESRTPRDDGRDRSVILDTLTGREDATDFAYDWRTKSEPLIWVADAVGGAVREHLVGTEPEWYDPISKATNLSLSYRSLPRT